ncbi:hypothetical protein A1O1_08755 [Capronia coronata CBS 617.96]|uniref:Phytanoyl-CoA dioxygenase n=1 Tax=Capronia coronata CBS 617.96 TaxID=1182541 RepID=W9XR89_9EURO|nr:uncharacterized protein A1O1_08755 [Capronia coronata CBS 617.96]EXJ79491.1 hypothetical protein A1O1_08755 [Capronia coronata CBS 617.96]
MAPHADYPETTNPPPKKLTPLWKEDLEKFGVAVVPGVLSKERCDYYTNSFFDWLESFPYGFSRDDPSTYVPEYLPSSMKGGMYHGYKCQHEKFVWEARLEPSVIKVFEEIWGTDKLLVSFDGFNFTLPATAKLLPKEETAPWPHVDQSPQRKGLHCVQGIINIAPNGPQDGGLVVMKGSHHHFTEFFKHNEGKRADWGSEDWRGFSEEQMEWFKERGCELTKVCAGPGDVILWDSRCVHYNVLPEGDQLRALFYACYTPAEFATQENLEKKREIFRRKQGTTHWPHDNLWFRDEWKRPRLGNPDTYNRDTPRQEIEATDKMLKLAAIIPY